MIAVKSTARAALELQNSPVVGIRMTSSSRRQESFHCAHATLKYAEKGTGKTQREALAKVVSLCSAVVGRDVSNVKGYYRRALANKIVACHTRNSRTKLHVTTGNT